MPRKGEKIVEEIRFIVTSLCNFNCIFCHREGCKKINRKKFLSPRDFSFIFEVISRKFGITRCTITGGEPLLRKDILEIVKELKKKGAKITMVTNGVFLERKKEILNYISELHVSIHSLQSKKFMKITGTSKNYLPKIIKNLLLAKSLLGSKKIKINMCLVKGLNDNFEDFRAMVEFCRKHNLHLRVIELLKPYDKGFFSPITQITSWIEQFGVKKIYNHPYRYRETVYVLKDGTKISKIIYLCNYRFHYPKDEIERRCKSFMDFFITPDGKINLCFLANKTYSIYESVKKRDERRLVEIFKKAYENIGKYCPLQNINREEFLKFKKYFSERKTFQLTTVYCVLIRKNKILLLRRKDIDVFEFPGGNIEFFETPKEAIIREVKEETGLEPKNIKLLCTSSVTYPNNFVQQLLIFFISSSFSGKKIKLSSEHCEYKWVSLKKIWKLNNLALSAKVVIPRVIEYVRKTTKEL